MYITIDDQLSFMHYLDLTRDQQIEVVQLLWEYYEELSREEELPPDILLRMDMHDLIKEEAYEICELYKHTRNYGEWVHNK